MGKTSKVQSWGPWKCGVANMEASGQVQMVEKSMLLRARDGSRSGGGGLGRFHAGNGRPTNGIGEAGGDHRSPLQGQGKLILGWTASVLPPVRGSGGMSSIFDLKTGSDAWDESAKAPGKGATRHSIEPAHPPSVRYGAASAGGYRGNKRTLPMALLIRTRRGGNIWVAGHHDPTLSREASRLIPHNPG